MRRFNIFVSLGLWILTACGETPRVDAGVDGGSAELDAGANADAGRTDAGPDAGGTDAGAGDTDAGDTDGGGVDGGGVDAGADGGLAAGRCAGDPDCDDGSACTTDTCTAGVCIHSASNDCDWPAESSSDAENLTNVGGTEFEADLSGAVWNPVTRTLWLCRNNGPSMVWAVVEDGSGGYRIDTRSGAPAMWSGFGDAEAVAQADFGEGDIVYVLDEAAGTVSEVDFSVGGAEVENNQWDLSTELGDSGAEGMTFVPDAFLSAQGFVNGSGAAYTSTQGMGGLMFIGHQDDGEIYVYDLNRATGAHLFVGRYETGGNETAGLEFDRSTGQLFIWHDAGIDELELTWLSSTNGTLDTIVTYDEPEPAPSMSTNIEGVAVQPIDDCQLGRRNLFLTIDGGEALSLLLYSAFPC